MKLTLACGLLATLALLGGCSRPLGTYQHVFERYYATTLGLSTSADVISFIRDPQKEMLSQSESVIASWGKKGSHDRTHWFTMTAFDQDSAAAVRKYGFILEETTVGWNRKPSPVLRLDAELKLEAAVLEEPYPNANAMRLAVLRRTSEMFGADAREVSFDSATLRSSAAMVNQAFQHAVVRLMQSPAEAARLSELEGMAFDHMTLGKSRIRMLIEGTTVKVKIKAGSRWFAQPFEQHPDVIGM